jgi:hypothetical protein
MHPRVQRDVADGVKQFDPEVRLALAQRESRLDPQAAATLCVDPAPEVRLALAQRSRWLPAPVVAQLQADREPQVAEVANNRGDTAKRRAHHLMASGVVETPKIVTIPTDRIPDTRRFDEPDPLKKHFEEDAAAREAGYADAEEQAKVDKFERAQRAADARAEEIMANGLIARHRRQAEKAAKKAAAEAAIEEAAEATLTVTRVAPGRPQPKPKRGGFRVGAVPDPKPKPKAKAKPKADPAAWNDEL